MTTYTWIVCGLAAFDILVVTMVLLLHYFNFLDRRSRVALGVGLSGFVFHAVLFFDGPIQAMQLAMLAVIYIQLVFWPLPRQSAERDRGQTS
jgi:hypothetical protein